MKSKDKQIKELRKHFNKGFNIAHIVNIIWGIIALIIGLTLMFQIGDLKYELESCQEKVPIWTFDIKCRWHNVSMTSYETNEYNNHAVYERELKKFAIDRDYFIKQDWKTCEVIE